MRPIDNDELALALLDKAERRASTEANGLNDAAHMIGDLTFHLRAVLGIIDRTGGYMSTADQETLRAARKAVAHG